MNEIPKSRPWTIGDLINIVGVIILAISVINTHLYYDKTPYVYASEFILSEGNLPSRTDRWGTELRADYSQGENSNVLVVRSAGRDKIFDTSDDLVAEEIDINKSRVVGKWIGNKTRETVSGFLDGWSSKSKHTNKSGPEAIEQYIKNQNH